MRTKPVIGITTDYDMQENRYYLREEYEKAIARPASSARLSSFR